MIYEINKNEYIGKYFGLEGGYFLTFNLNSKKEYSINEVKDLLNSCYGATKQDKFGRILDISISESKLGYNNEKLIQIKLLFETLDPYKSKEIIYISWETKDRIILADTENEMFNAFRLAREVGYGN